MNWNDLLRMSINSLRRRKLRTFLTVLGVLIGTASIVVMISLGLGLQQSLYKEVEQSGGLTSITVTGTDGDEGMMTESGNMSSDEQSVKRIDDQLVGKIQKMDHVKMAYPIYETSVILLKGSYIANVQLRAMPPEGLKALNLDLGDGTLPKTGTGHLDLVFGNGVITDFYEKGTGNGYYETGEIPKINLKTDSLFMITDAENYNTDSSAAFGESADDGSGSSSDQGTQKSGPVQKYVVKASGVVAGGLDDYTENYDYVYCDLETLKMLLRKEYAGKVIPGQPQTKAGKPLKEFYYTTLKVKADDMDHVNEVADMIRNMGYSVETNAEYLNSMKSQFAIVQAVLGGIGAVSLLVAAIGIANTMMMSIYERTKEIGVMKVLGCSLGNIQEMFLLEAGFIGLLGGIAGNILSFLMSSVINLIVGNSGMLSMSSDSNISYIPWWLVLVSMGFAIVVGVLAGYFPSRRAMKLSPLAAIRNE